MRIAFLGDSLTEGSPGASYLRLLRPLLPGHELLNHGRAGDSVVDLYARLQHVALEPVDLAVIWIGTNDAAMGEWTSWAYEAFEPITWRDTLDRIAAVYARLLALTLERAPQAVCVPPVIADELDEAWGRRVADIAELVGAAVGGRAQGVTARPRAGLRPRPREGRRARPLHHRRRPPLGGRCGGRRACVRRGDRGGGGRVLE